MPTFVYQGRNPEGLLVKGRRLAQSADNLSLQLLKEGIIPVSISETRERFNLIQFLRERLQGSTISTEELSMFARQMHTLVKTGVPITAALRQLSENARTVRMSNALYGIVESLESGQDLATSMQAYPHIFTPIMVNMIRVGQGGGHLDEAFLRLNQYLELESVALKKAKTAFRYPMLIMIMLFVAVIFINIFVVPTFSKVFIEGGIELPQSTKILIGFSNIFVNYWWLALLILAGIVFAIYKYLSKSEGRYKWHRFMLKIPIVGTILRRIILLRFAQSFAIVIYSGIPLVEGVRLVGQSINNDYAKQEILSMEEALQHGKTITQAAAATSLFTPLELQMLAVSEETGELAQMLDQVANFYRREVEYDLKRLNDLIEPILIIVLSLVVLGMAFSVYLPIWNMVKLVHH